MTDRLFSAHLEIQEDGSSIKRDVIKYSGKLWIVSDWLELPLQKVSKPKRIIRFDNRRHNSAPTRESPRPEYILIDPVPKALLYDIDLHGRAFSYEYIDRPEIEIPDFVRPLGTTRGLH